MRLKVLWSAGLLLAFLTLVTLSALPFWSFGVVTALVGDASATRAESILFILLPLMVIGALWLLFWLIAAITRRRDSSASS